jgi:hypothetical protein
MKKKFDSFYLEYMGWIKRKNHLTLLSLSPKSHMAGQVQNSNCTHASLSGCGVRTKVTIVNVHVPYTELEFLKSLWGLGTEEE